MFGGVGVRKPPAAGKVGGKDSQNVEVEESLGALERARLLGCSKLSLQRLVFVNELVDCAHEIGYECTVGHLLPLVHNLASDPEVLVRQNLVGQFGDLAGFLIQSDPERGYQKVVDELLPIVSSLLAEKACEVRQGAVDALTTLASHLRPGERGDQVLMTVISLSHSNDDEDARSTAVQLLNGLAETLGHDLCRSFVGVELVALCEDPSFRVRKATATNFAEVSRVVGDDYVLRRLLPAYSKLVSDQHWGVRKAAAESLIGVVMALKAESREAQLMTLINSLLKDSSRWVRMSALQQLGYFIAALEKSERVPDDLFRQYVDIIEQTKANPDCADISYHCGYTYAAVARTMGYPRWMELQAPFLSLCRDPQLKTRKAMAASIHIVAETVGPEVAEQEVLPQYEALLQDGAHEVRHAALKKVPEMLRAAPRATPQQRILKAMQGAMGNKAESWRLRHLVASQLGGICEALVAMSGSVEGTSLSSSSPAPGSQQPAAAEVRLPADADAAARGEGEATSLRPVAKDHQDLVLQVVVPMFLSLCQDPVAEVRDEASRATARALRGAAPELLVDPIPSEGSSGCPVRQPPRLVRELIRTFARGESFRHRMAFVRMCDSIIREAPLHVFMDFFMKPLARIYRDRVKNVRLCWATCMLPHVRKAGRLGHCRVLVGAANRMAANDSCEEVKRVLHGALGDIDLEASDKEILDGEAQSDLDEPDLNLGDGGTGSDRGNSVADAEELVDDLGGGSGSGNTAVTAASGLAGFQTSAVEVEDATGAAPASVATRSPLSPSASSGFHPTPRSPTTSPDAAPTAACFDPVEDSIVDQHDVDGEMDKRFADRRLLEEQREALVGTALEVSSPSFVEEQKQAIQSEPQQPAPAVLAASAVPPSPAEQKSEALEGGEDAERPSETTQD